MKNDFEKFRKWRRFQAVFACALILALVLVAISTTSSDFAYIGRRDGLRIAGIVCALGVIMNIVALNITKNLRCPHCGKSFMSKWMGRDAAGRNCAKRIEKRLPILCFNCGQEIDTN